MSEWRIYYGDGSVVSGQTREEWVRAPDEDVQAVVLMEPYPDRDGLPYRPWAGVDDRRIWTGLEEEDGEYDPFGWGVKRGAWMAHEEYFALFDRARTD